MSSNSDAYNGEPSVEERFHYTLNLISFPVLHCNPISGDYEYMQFTIMGNKTKQDEDGDAEVNIDVHFFDDFSTIDQRLVTFGSDNNSYPNFVFCLLILKSLGDINSTENSTEYLYTEQEFLEMVRRTVDDLKTSIPRDSENTGRVQLFKVCDEREQERELEWASQYYLGIPNGNMPEEISIPAGAVDESTYQMLEQRAQR